MNSIDKYLSETPPAHRIELERLRSIIRSAYPNSEEGLYYGMPAFKLNGKAFIAFRTAKNHLSLHPLSGSVVESLSSRLVGYVVSKGTIRFTPEKPLPERLVRAVLRCRAQEISSAT